jgi:hypothetical protein
MNTNLYLHEQVSISELAEPVIQSNILVFSLFNLYTMLLVTAWILFTIMLLFWAGQSKFHQIKSHYQLQLSRETGKAVLVMLHDISFFIILGIGTLLLFPHIFGPFFGWIVGKGYEPTSYLFTIFHPLFTWGLLVLFLVCLPLKIFFNTTQTGIIRTGYGIGLVAAYILFTLGMVYIWMDLALFITTGSKLE